MPASQAPVGVDGDAVLVLVGVLAEVPHVAVGVLGEPVVGVLDDLAVDVHGVADDDGGDPHHLAGVVEDLDLDAFRLAVALALVHPSGPGCVRKVRVVDHLDEVGRIDVRRVVAAVARVDDRRRLGRVDCRRPHRTTRPSVPMRAKVGWLFMGCSSRLVASNVARSA